MASDTKTREEFLKGQILVGSFLSAFDPILRPFEDLAKHGISLSVGVIGLSGTAISVLGRSNPTDTRSATLLSMSWVVLIGSVVFGCLQLWRCGGLTRACPSVTVTLSVQLSAVSVQQQQILPADC